MLFRRHAPVNPKANRIFFFFKESACLYLFILHTLSANVQGNMLETKCLCLTAVELGRDSDVLNVLSSETFPLHCKWTCLPTFIITVDIHI